ncbi:hypothetical protein MCOR17_011372 [Pyricularia oryzae]|nr:hypothetical protein MCOR17_011372 [Pyricularia oryzae]
MMAASKRATASAPRLASPPPQALLQHAAPVFLGGVRERVAGGDLAVRLRLAVRSYTVGYEHSWQQPRPGIEAT